LVLVIATVGIVVTTIVLARIGTEISGYFSSGEGF